MRPVEEVQRLAKELKKAQDENGAALAVGYMLRYSPAVGVYFQMTFHSEIFWQMVYNIFGLKILCWQKNIRE